MVFSLWNFFVNKQDLTLPPLFPHSLREGYQKSIDDDEASTSEIETFTKKDYWEDFILKYKDDGGWDSKLRFLD